MAGKISYTSMERAKLIYLSERAKKKTTLQHHCVFPQYDGEHNLQSDMLKINYSYLN